MCTLLLKNLINHFEFAIIAIHKNTYLFDWILYPIKKRGSGFESFVYLGTFFLKFPKNLYLLQDEGFSKVDKK